MSSTALVARKLNSTPLSRPVFATSPPRDTQRLFIVEQHTGKIRIFRLATNTIDATPFLQVTGLSTGNEQGLLGLAFAPDFDATGFLYVNFTDTAGATVIRRYRVLAANPDVADAASATNVLTIPQPFSNHNGGWIAFSPKDKFLYIGVGDGGSENDPNKTSQDPKLLLGKMLRIDVTKDAFPADPAKNYAIPADNPFAGAAAVLPEIWALGLRNPWRCSFDRKTSDLYIGDVGQNSFEEIDFQRAASAGGENYGWSLREGRHPFKPQPGAAPALVDPIFEYTHDNGEQAIVGGYVYRGAAIPDLQGTYFFADITGLVSSLVFDGAAVTNERDRTDELFPAGSPAAISSFAENASGEIYLLNLLPGELFKIVPKN
jgi:glucose/arabinose dehydrogenase